jgi:hypothetical protein
MTEPIKKGIQNAGDVNVADVTLICSNGQQIDLIPFMAELNITEDIFSPAMYGNIVIADSLGIIEAGPIIGEEYLRVDVVTPGMDDTRINKTFRVYNISNRELVQDDKSQVFILHFCSQEVFIDSIAKIYKTFSGRVDEVAAKVYVDYLQTGRNIVINKDNQFVDSEDSTVMVIPNDFDNQVKFTCPGWGAMKTLSWLASKSLTSDKKAADTLFYESSKAFYFGSIGSIMKSFTDQKKVAASFYYSPSNHRIIEGPIAVNGVQYTAPNLNREYKIVEDFRVLDQFNTLKSNQNGYYANQVLTVDLMNKGYKYNDFDYVASFDNYNHLDKFAPFTSGQFRNPNLVTQVAYQTPGMFDGITGNIDERVAAIKQARMSLLGGLTNIRIEGTVPGRTDFEVGSVVYFGMPKLGPKDGKDQTEAFDEYMSGLYLVSAIRHKIDVQKHVMIVEMVKDSFDTAIH